MDGIYSDAASLAAEVVGPGLLDPGEEMVALVNPSAPVEVNTFDRAVFAMPSGLTAEVLFQVVPVLYVVDGLDGIAYQYAAGVYRDLGLLEPDTTDDDGNAAARGITASGDSLWTTDSATASDADEVFGYATDFTLQARWGQSVSNADSVGITTDGSRIWAVDATDLRVYRYEMDGSPDASDPSFPLGVGNSSPAGITTDGTHILVVDDPATGGQSGTVYRYDMDGGPDPDQPSFALESDNDDPVGIATDGSYIWVVDAGTDTVYRYAMDGGYTGFNFPLNAAAGNEDPQGITVRTR